MTRNQQRALRLSGEEPAGKAGRDAWAAADDLVLRKIAQAGFSGLTAMVNGTAPGGCAAARPRAGPARPGGRQRGTGLARFGRIPRQRAELHRPLTHEIVARDADFAQENRSRRVASQATSLISPRSSKRAGSVGIPIC